MKMYKNTGYTLLLGLALGVGVSSLTAQAESEARLLIHHRILPAEQTNNSNLGRMQVEVINAGTAIINDATLSLEDTLDIQTIPSHFVLGKIESNQAKTINISFMPTNPTNDNIRKALVWRIEYLGTTGEPQHLTILDDSRNEPPPNGE